MYNSALVDACVASSLGSGGRGVDDLGERGPANQPVLVGVHVHKELQQGVVQLKSGSSSSGRSQHSLLLHEPDEVLLGLVEGVHGGLGTELALVAVSTRQPTLQCTGQH